MCSMYRGLLCPGNGNYWAAIEKRQMRMFNNNLADLGDIVELGMSRENIDNFTSAELVAPAFLRELRGGVSDFEH